jgi:hypothetical protein
VIAGFQKVISAHFYVFLGDYRRYARCHIGGTIIISASRRDYPSARSLTWPVTAIAPPAVEDIFKNARQFIGYLQNTSKLRIRRRKGTIAPHSLWTKLIWRACGAL